MESYSAMKRSGCELRGKRSAAQELGGESTHSVFAKGCGKRRQSGEDVKDGQEAGAGGHAALGGMLIPGCIPKAEKNDAANELGQICVFQGQLAAGKSKLEKSEGRAEARDQ